MLDIRRAAGAAAASFILAISVATGPAVAADASATPGLAPQFSRWPVPLYASHVEKTMTWATNSYEVDTSDSVDRVTGWYRARLKDRAQLIHGRVLQLAVDGGSYVINILKNGAHGASINVIKN